MFASWEEWSDVNTRLQARRQAQLRIVTDPTATANAQHFARQRIGRLDAALDDLERHEMCRRLSCPVCDRVRALADALPGAQPHAGV